MTKSELEKERKRLKDELEDLEDAIAFNLMNTSAHIPGGHVRQDEELLEELKGKIAEIEKTLNKSNGNPGGS
jgi:peptidoglycan hydrolase CwlO-like protein